MDAFWNLRRIRSFIALDRQLERYDAFAELHCDTDRPVDRVTVRISLFGLRAEAEGKTGLAALNVIRREHPAAAHVVYTYFTAMAMLLALALAILSLWGR
ncbi:hypothetical protein ACIHCQ_01140 [Streptomyces sp. NPDC052236]|uniref:hypothetical protein n=1 Tax=Streptomyces sp. NPDC052236 TaxID=3365686 RepID=UPI0037CE3853